VIQKRRCKRHYDKKDSGARLSPFKTRWPDSIWKLAIKGCQPGDRWVLYQKRWSWLYQ